ncbi:MAG: HEAT repeat domain-containing protein [bacterium]
MNSKNNVAKKFMASALVISAFFSMNTQSFASNISILNNKKQAYVEITKVIYDKSIYTPYKIELLRRFAVLNGININSDNQEPHDVSIQNDKSLKDIEDFKKFENSYLNKKINNKTYFSCLIKELSHSEDQSMKDFAGNILETVKADDYFSLFESLLNSDKVEQRIIAIKGLSRIGDDKSLNLLIERYKKADFAEKKELTFYIGKFKNKKAVLFCENAIKSEAKPELLINLYVNMINYGKSDYLAYYRVKLYDKDYNTSKYALLKLNDVVPDIDFKYLKQLMYLNDGVSRLAITSYFEKRLNNSAYKPYNSEIIQQLAKYASDNAVILKIAAVKDLSLTNNPEVCNVLRPLLKDPQLGDTIINIILSSKNPALLPLIKDIAKIDNEIVKFYSALSLLDVDNNISLELFTQLSKDSESDNIRLVSTYILDKLSSPSLPPFSKNTKLFINYVKNFENTDDLLDIIYETINNVKIDNFNIKTRLASRSAQFLPYTISSAEISSYLNSDDNWIKLNAALNLIKRGDKSALNTVRDIIKQNKDPKVLSAAIEIIGDYGDMSDIENLSKTMNNASYARIRGNSALAILEITKRVNLD